MRLTKLDDEAGLIRLSCEGNITHKAIMADVDPIRLAIGEGGLGANVLLSLEKTNFIDSSGISWLLVTHKSFKDAGGRLVLHSVPPMVDQVLRLMKLSLVLNIAADEAAARAMVSGSVA